MSEYSFERYLSSKRSVDDRALNRTVFERLRQELAANARERPAILEVGAGIGSMLTRLVEWRLLERADYTLLDEDPELSANVERWLMRFASAHSATLTKKTEGWSISSKTLDLNVRVVSSELYAFLAQRSHAAFDCLLANAFLDLVELPLTLEKLFALLRADGVYWFSVNYDGETLFVPEHASDSAFMRVYNRSMDERLREGRPAGDSKTGRRLFQHLPAAGANILAAGASDWVVHANAGAYPEDEAYFLHHIVDTIERELRQHAEVDARELAAWGAARHAEIERGELVYIAHQLDFMGRVVKSTRAGDESG